MRVRVLDAGDLPTLPDATWVDHSRQIYRKGETAYVPVREECAADTDLPERVRYRGRKYCMLGNVAVLHGKVPSEAEIQQVTDWTGATAVVHLSSIAGVMRTPLVGVLRGTCGDVIHRENGITYRFDPSQVMFAMGNRRERERMGRIVSPGERVGDLCAGIGYFTIPMARAGASVHAIELNPVSYRYLCHNTVENRVGERVIPVLGDCRSCMSGTYNRIVIGHFQAAEFLPAALRHVRKGTMLHIHGLSDTPDPIKRCIAQSGFSASVQVRRVKKYGPHTWHIVRDVVLS
ncbi:MAG: SAM-dependent methyltransferase [Methanomicrobiales archaeon]|nr:SAM-dependent methyltransferase [Methanomicrobiales archaeon]